MILLTLMTPYGVPGTGYEMNKGSCGVASVFLVSHMLVAECLCPPQIHMLTPKA